MQSVSGLPDPRIVDSSVGSPGSAQHYFSQEFGDDVVYKSGAQLSMSACNESIAPNMLELYTTGGGPHSDHYGHYAPPNCPSQMFYQTDMPGNIQTEEFRYADESEVSPLQSFSHHQPPVRDHRLQEALEITTHTTIGHEGSPVRVELEACHDLLVGPRIVFSFLFNHASTVAYPQVVGTFNDSTTKYVFTAQAPPFARTGALNTTISLSLKMEIPGTSTEPAAFRIGTFSYVPSSSNQSHKRKASSGSENDLQPLPKRAGQPTTHLRQHTADTFEYAETSPYSSYIPTPTGSGIFPSQARNVSPRPNGHHYSTSSVSQASLTAPSPHTPAWSPSFATIKTEHSPQPPVTPAPRPTSAASVLRGSAPKLVRTSTIQQSPPGLHPAAAIHTQSFNPYSMPIKANLKLNGDLNKMTTGWNPEEYDSRRRLVELTRTQNGSTITADFKAVSPEERSPNKPTISCIWWKEKDEYFVTSVDTIYLLESLVGVRFTVEEKNRIRRNLEGFKPSTVSKSKSDSESFFKVIMNFPAPKPRNIEKDVKVFPWTILAASLKKIIGKYSASYSSTLSQIPTPAASAYASTESSVDYIGAASHPDYDTSSMPAYAAAPTSGYSPAHHQGQMPDAVAAAPYQDLRLYTPMTVPYNISSNPGFQPMPNVSQTVGHNPQPLSAPPTVRIPDGQFYQYSPFVNMTTADMAPHSAPSSSYPRGGFETAEFYAPASYATGSE